MENYVEYANNILKYCFGLELSMGERMLLRQQVGSAIKGLEDIKPFTLNTYSPGVEGAVRFIYYNYGEQNIEEVINTAFGYVSKDLTERLRFKMEKYD